MSSVIQTYTGIGFDPLNPESSKIRIMDIAHSLSMQARFTGHIREFYSVAQHCVLGSLFIDREYALQFLLHDASEAYLTDVPTPVKRILPMYQTAENNLQENIYDRFGIITTEESNAAVKEIDLRMLKTEREWLMAWGREVEWGLDDIKSLPIRYNYGDEYYSPWDWRKAKNLFLERFAELHEV